MSGGAVGSSQDAMVAAGAAGSVIAQLRRTTTALGTSAADLTSLVSALGAVADASVAAGATGSVAAKLRRVTTDLDAALTALVAVRAAVEGTLTAKPAWAIPTLIDVSLIGINDSVATGKFGPSVKIIATGSTGEILHMLVRQTASGAALGAILSDLAGDLWLFKADPVIAAGDGSPTKAAFGNLIGKVPVSNGGLTALASGSAVQISDYPLGEVAPVYAAFRSSGATTINSAAGDNEEVRLVASYRRDS